MTQDAENKSVEPLTPQEMREMFARNVYDIAWKTPLHFPDKRVACEVVAREIMSLIDGNYSEEMPPFLLTPVPDERLNQHCTEVVEYTWPSDTPINPIVPETLETVSMVSLFDAAQERHKASALGMFK